MKLPVFSNRAMKHINYLYNFDGNMKLVQRKARELLTTDEYQAVQEFRKRQGFTFVQALYHIVHKLSKAKTCERKSCGNLVTWKRKGFNNQYKLYCSTNCSNTDEATKEKAKQTCLTKFGVENASQSETIKQKKVATCLSNHGVEHPSQSRRVRKKIIKAVRERYGVDNVSQSKEVLRAKKKTWIAKYGFDNPSKSPEIKRIIGRKVHSTLARKKVVNSQGKQYILQGYEPQALKYIRRFFKYRHIHDQSSGKVPNFEYFDGRERLYFPDFLIQTGDYECIVEVKSTYTFCSTLSRYRTMRAKAAAVKDAGYRFKLLVMQADGSRIKLPSDWHNLSHRKMREYLSQQGCRL